MPGHPIKKQLTWLVARSMFRKKYVASKYLQDQHAAAKISLIFSSSPSIGLSLVFVKHKKPLVQLAPIVCSIPLPERTIGP